MTIPRGTAQSPKYQRLAADLRRRIAEGEFTAEAALPVESELERQYGVARNTVRLAVDVLVNEGRLVRLQGKGTYLREHPVLDHRAYGPAPGRDVRPSLPGPAGPSGASGSSGSSGSSGLSGSVGSVGMPGLSGALVASAASGSTAATGATGVPGAPGAEDGPRDCLAVPSAVYRGEAADAGRELTVDFEMMIVRARIDIAERLGLRPGEAIVVRRQLRLLDREPYSIEESHYRAGLAAGTPLMEPDQIDGGDEAVLAALGRTEIGAVDHLVARMPGPEEAQWFQGGPGVPLVVQTRVTYDRRGPVRVIETRYSADRSRLVYGIGDLAARASLPAPAAPVDPARADAP
ncbi:GntR family transcriptional regulator [Streptomyces sp. BE20]|uniref:GntR family transcriptional regulator n=1 Tax=Streptomyces sp. BE20 TaxID=3002525 RepID=UPI002E77ECA5|nr:GntR family transcriptional regulator [Streptomyces sp. BE20]MEE1826975.1 GntR family transcriptional regulator [Streptomyces sp. BE20]